MKTICEKQIVPACPTLNLSEILSQDLHYKLVSPYIGGDVQLELFDTFSPATGFFGKEMEAISDIIRIKTIQEMKIIKNAIP